MIQLSAQLRNVELVQKRFEDFSGDVMKVGVKTIYDIVFKGRNELATYPPAYAGDPPHEWASEKQRRYVMWAIKTGRIQVPYKRTGKYGWEWRIQRDRSIPQSDGIAYRLYNKQPYAVWVSGDAEGEKQARIHQGRWTPFRQRADQIIEKVPATIQQKITEVARRRGF